MRDLYTEGYAQGCADRQDGCDYAPEEDGDEYERGYEEGWEATAEDEED